MKQRNGTKNGQNDCLFIFELIDCFKIQYLVTNYNNYLRIQLNTGTVDAGVKLDGPNARKSAAINETGRCLDGTVRKWTVFKFKSRRSCGMKMDALKR